MSDFASQDAQKCDVYMDRWQIIRTAHYLAKLGTISATAHELGVHRATVLRHIDALEEELGVNLFQRHPRGYIPTEAGKDLMQVVSATEDQIGQMVARLKQKTEPLSGEFIITSLAPLASVLIPILKTYQELHPAVQVQYLTSEKLFRLEFGEAHVAVRTGPKPDLPDNVVIPFATHRISLFAHTDYLARYGHPTEPGNLEGHKFISFADLIPRVPIHKWILSNISEKDIALKSNDGQVIKQALLDALGIGFMFQHEAKKHAELVQLFPPLKDWEVQHWLVTHRDLHRSIKVQAFLEVLRSQTEHDKVID